MPVALALEPVRDLPRKVLIREFTALEEDKVVVVVVVDDDDDDVAGAEEPSVVVEVLDGDDLPEEEVLL